MLHADKQKSIQIASNNEINCLVVDEAHRLNEKSGLFANMGENQVKEIIKAANFSIFFIDENQKVTLKDIGSLDVIKKYAEEAKVAMRNIRRDGMDYIKKLKKKNTKLKRKLQPKNKKQTKLNWKLKNKKSKTNKMRKKLN